jgi:hypothetical protein
MDGRIEQETESTVVESRQKWRSKLTARLRGASTEAALPVEEAKVWIGSEEVYDWRERLAALLPCCSSD